MRLIGKTSITWRLTLLFAGASSVVLLALGLVIASSVEKHFEDLDMEVLGGKMELARHALASVKSQDDLQGLSQQLDDSLVGHHGLEVMVISANQTVIFATHHARFPPQLIASSVSHVPYRAVQWTLGGQTYRAVAAELPTGANNGTTVMVAVATDIEHHQP